MAIAASPKNPQRAARLYGLMLCGIVIDVDHLLADPIYDPERCSIGFHPLHTLVPALLYALALIPKRTRWIAVGLCLHIALDISDCSVEQLRLAAPWLG